MLNIEQFSTTGTATAAGLLIPVADLPSIDAAELDGSVAGRDKAVLALLNAYYDTISPANFDKLGIAVAKANPTGAGNDLVNQNYSATFEYYVDHETETVAMIPVPSAGANDGVGAIALADLFPGASAVAAAGATSAGILIPDADVATYGGPAAGSIPTDARDYLVALYHHIVIDSPVRSGSVQSAVINSSRGSATGFAAPATWTQPTDPVSGLAAADLPKSSFFRVSFSMTMQILLNQTTQEFDVNSVTA